jgi:hypothetical protein
MPAYPCQQCGRFFAANQLWGGLCGQCSQEAAPPYLELVGMVTELRETVKELRECLKKVESRISSRPQQGVLL